MRKRLKDEEERGAAKVKRGKAEGSGTVSLMTEWWRRHVLGENPPPQLRPEQRAILAATRREQRLDELLGLPVRPPAAPSGADCVKGCHRSIRSGGLFAELMPDWRFIVFSSHTYCLFVFSSNTYCLFMTNRPVHLWGCWQRQEPAGWLVLSANR